MKQAAGLCKAKSQWLFQVIITKDSYCSWHSVVRGLSKVSPQWWVKVECRAKFRSRNQRSAHLARRSHASLHMLWCPNPYFNICETEWTGSIILGELETAGERKSRPYCNSLMNYWSHNWDSTWNDWVAATSPNVWVTLALRWKDSVE